MSEIIVLEEMENKQENTDLGKVEEVVNEVQQEEIIETKESSKEELQLELSKDVERKLMKEAKNIVALEERNNNYRNKIYDVLLDYKNKGTVLRAALIGVAQENNVVYAVCKYNGVRVLIPHNLYFDKNFNLGEKYNEATEEHDKTTAIREVMSHQIGSLICFTIQGVQKEVAEGDSKSFALGNRLNALEKLERYYFGDKEDFSDAKYKVGDTVDGYVLFAGKSSITVEVLGVETRIDRRELPSINGLESLQDNYKPGDKIKLRIRKLHRRLDGNGGLTSRVYLAVSGIFRVKEIDLDNMKEGDLYQGKVEKYNKEKGLYTIRLENNVIVNVIKNNVSRRKLLTEGDVVCVLITKTLENRCFGKVTYIY